MDLGTELRQARERAGCSLHDLAGRTRIPLHHLQAIEQNELSKLPAGIFGRSFIRTYAREFGVDPTEAIAEYRALTEPKVEPVEEIREALVTENPNTWRSSLWNFIDAHPRWGSGAIVITLLISVISINKSAARNPAEHPANHTATPPVVTTAVKQPPEAPTPVATTPVATTGTGLQMELRAQGECWVRAVVDGDEVFARLLLPGETQALSAQRDIVLRVGDPATLSYTVNGREGQPLGVAAVPVTVRFDHDGSAARAS